MIAPREVAIEQQAEKVRPSDKCHGRLFQEFARQSMLGGLAGINTASRQVPAGYIGMTHQQHLTRLVDHHGAYAERHAVGEAPPAMDEPGDKRRARWATAL